MPSPFEVPPTTFLAESRSPELRPPTFRRKSLTNFGRVAAMNSESNKPLSVVTGGSRGLGYVVAKALKAAGNRVLIISKDPGVQQKVRPRLIANSKL